MDFKKLIHQHNELLEKQAEENVHLGQQIKLKLKAPGKTTDLYRISLRKYVFIYSTLLFFFTFINFLGIRLISKNTVSAKPETISKMDVFQADYPGSINQIYQEVLKWEK